jgi:hypothetical protein
MKYSFRRGAVVALLGAGLTVMPLGASAFSQPAEDNQGNVSDDVQDGGQLNQNIGGGTVQQAGCGQSIQGGGPGDRSQSCVINQTINAQKAKARAAAKRVHAKRRAAVRHAHRARAVGGARVTFTG